MHYSMTIMNTVLINTDLLTMNNSEKKISFFSSINIIN